MTEKEFQSTKAALLEIIQDASQPARERNHAADTLIALEEKRGSLGWFLDLDSPVQPGVKREQKQSKRL